MNISPDENEGCVTFGATPQTNTKIGNSGTQKQYNLDKTQLHFHIRVK